MTYSVSEYARLLEELEDLKAAFRDGAYRSKASKEILLDNIRKTAIAAGVEVPNYNSKEFSEFIRQTRPVS